MVVGLLGVCVAVPVVWLLPQRLLDDDNHLGDLRALISQGIVALGLLIGVYFTSLNVRTNRITEGTKLLQGAIEQLDAPSDVQRIGAIGLLRLLGSLDERFASLAQTVLASAAEDETRSVSVRTEARAALKALQPDVEQTPSALAR